jgi:hypothetical protein
MTACAEVEQAVPEPEQRAAHDRLRASGTEVASFACYLGSCRKKYVAVTLRLIKYLL